MKPALINFELLYLEDVLKGKVTNIVNNENFSVKKKRLTANASGIFTKELGSTTNPEEEILDYRCECGHLNGRIYENTLCPECQTVCKEEFAADINKFGWIDIAPYKVMTPDGFEFVKRIIGETGLNRIIDYDVMINIDGNIVINDKQTGVKTPYANCGLIDFYKNFEKIVTYYGGRKNRMELVDFVIANKKRIFTNKIPVMSQLLRPVFMSNNSESISYDKINSPYSTIITNAELLKKYEKSDKMTINRVLNTIQLEWSSLYSYIINKKLKGKKQMVRGQVQGSRMNYTARHIIVANTGPEFDIDSVEVSYNGFLRLYKLEIINVLSRGLVGGFFRNMTPYEIRDYVDIAEFKSYIDPYIFSAINYLLDNHKIGFYCLCVRPPSLDMGSGQLVRITKVSDNIDSKVLKVPLTSLKSWNGDFDGDALILFAVKEKCLIEWFKALSPKQLILDRTNTEKVYNEMFGFVKDMGVPLYDFIRPTGILSSS